MTSLLSQVSKDILIIDFQETKILDQETVDTIGGEMEQLAENSDVSKILLDLNRIELMTSAMIGQMVAFNKKCGERNVNVKMCNLTSEIKKLFKITKLDTVFDIYRNREDAIYAFG